MAGARITPEGLLEIGEQFGEMGRRARMPEPLLRSQGVRSEFEQASHRRFRRGLRRAQRSWVLEKARTGRSTRTMVSTGAALIALTRHAGPAKNAVVFSAFNGEVRFGVRRGRSDLYYIQVHASGYKTTRGRGRARRVVLLDKTARENVATRVLVYVQSGDMHPVSSGGRVRSYV